MIRRKKSDGYMYGGSGPGSYYCRKCKGPHHKLSGIGKVHRKFKRF